MSANPRADHKWLEKIQRRERFADFAYTLARVNWDYFTTLTFTNPLPREHVRRAMFLEWLTEVSIVCKTPRKNLLIALRCEQGEIGGRPHLHALVGGVPSCNKMSLRSEMFRLWRKVANGGMPDIRNFDRSLAGADYICKCLGANAYEISKFSIAEETTLSDSVITLIGMLDANCERRFCEIKRKERQVARLAWA